MKKLLLSVALLTMASSAFAGVKIDVPSDPRASYELVEMVVRADGLKEITTMRDGPSGISYALRLVECPSTASGYLSEGDTLEEVATNKKDMTELIVPVADSISGVIADWACKN